MGTLTRVGLTGLVFLLLAVAIVVFKGAGMMQIVSAVIAIALILGIWLVSRMGSLHELRNKNAPQVVDRNAKKLIAIIDKKFNAQGIEEIGHKTQQVILETMASLQAGEFRSEKHAVDSLKHVPPSKYNEARDTTYMAATLAALYIIADELTDSGFKTKTRIDNFIAGIHDESF